jgi:hypothetical protein
MLVIFTRMDGSKVEVYCRPHNLGATEVAHMEYAGLQWCRLGGDVVSSHIPWDKSNKVMQADESSITHSLPDASKSYSRKGF